MELGTELPTLAEPVFVRIVSHEEPDHPHSPAYQVPLGLWLLLKEPDYPIQARESWEGHP